MFTKESIVWALEMKQGLYILLPASNSLMSFPGVVLMVVIMVTHCGLKWRLYDSGYMYTFCHIEVIHMAQLAT